MRYYLQRLGIIKKDDTFWKRWGDGSRKRMEKLRDKIYLETPWLSGKDNLGGEMKGLHFFEQGIKYHEYKNMVIQRRAQYVIIFLTIVLLIMTGLQIYLNFFK